MAGPAMDFLVIPLLSGHWEGTLIFFCLQGALMIMEAARNPAAGIFGGEFRHGPLEMSKKGFRAIVFAPLGVTYEQGIKLLKILHGMGEGLY